jgi:hypothetical protein
MRVLHDGPLHYTSVDSLATDTPYLAITHSIIRSLFAFMTSIGIEYSLSVLSESEKEDIAQQSEV